MTTSIAEPDIEPAERLLTVADLAVLPDELPSGPVKYELEGGKLIVMAPPGDIHGAAQLKAAFQLMLLGENTGHGKARTEVGVVMSRNPDTVLVPDAVFIANRSLPIRTSPEGYLETPPDIAVEVRSKNDSLRGLHRKAEKYLHAGVRVVWILDPGTKTITVFAKDAAPVQLGETGTLTAGEIIPGFSVRVAELFVV
jgi:Uma2 family endonuclease